MKNGIMVKAELKLKNVVGRVERVEGQNVYIAVKTRKGHDTYKFHIDQVTEIPKFANELQALVWEKLNKCSVPAENISFRLSEGNKKLKDNKVVSFYQWNITSVVTCPFKTAMCESSCYALKAEKMYPTVATRRDMNLKFSRSEGFVSGMIDQIQFELDRKKNQGKTIFFRIHEAGDFYSQEYMDKWVQIANHFKGNRKIVFMAYTKSLPFVKQAKKKFGDVNITFKSSIWEDTKEKFVKMTEDLGLSVFTAVDKGTMAEKNYFACPSSEAFKNTPKEKDCGQCKVCYLGNTNVAIEIH